MTTHATKLVVAVTALFALACPVRPQAPLPAPPPATITSFAISPAVLSAPGEVVLEWGTSNALDVTIEQVGKGPLDLGQTRGDGRLTVAVEADTVFLMTAQGAGGSDSKASSVTVQRRARSVLFSAVPSTVEAGSATTLVWNAPGAKAVTLTELNGARIDVGTQLESGSVRVTPTRSTTYQLTADAIVSTTAVTVAPTIVSFSAGNTLPGAGEPVTLSWQTASATTITLRRIGLATPLMVPAGQEATGTFTDTVPASLPSDAVLTYVLEASDGTTSTSRAIEVPVGGGVQVTSFNAPAYALTGSTFAITWATLGGESAELIVDGQRAYLAQSAAEVASGSYTLSAPTQSTRVDFIVRNRRGAEARESRTIQGVGPIAYNFFRADKTAIAAAGEPVTLEWSVTNARSVRITSNTGAGFYRQFTGNVDSGSLVVLPNSRTGLTRITYRLEADNGTGAAPIVRTVDVDVGAGAAFTFSRQLPIRAPTTVTGTTLGVTTSVVGFKNVEKNPAGEVFVDIRRTGTPVTFAAADGATNVLLPAAFEATLFGTRFSRTRLNISRFGWFNLSTSSTAVPGRPDNDAQLGSALEPLSIAPYWNNLVTASNQVHWQIDGVADARRLIVQWTNVRPTNGPIDARLTFQAQLYSSGKVVFAYRDFFKVQGRGTAGVVNNSETDEAGPTAAVAAGEVYRLLGAQAVPAPLRIESTPFAGGAVIGGAVLEAEGQANYPTNQFEISEVSPAPPTAVTNGQWVEIKNNADSGVDIGGWDLDFGGATSFQFPAGTTLPPFGRFLVGQAADLNDPQMGGITIEDGGVITRPGVDIVMPSTVQMPRSSSFARIGIGGTEYTRLNYGTVTTGASFGPEDLRAPWLTFSANTRLICDSVRYAYGTNGQVGSPGYLNAPCWPYQAWEIIPGNFTPIATATGAVALNFGSTTPDTLTAPLDLTLAGRTPIKLFGLATPITAALVAADGYVVIGGSTRCCDNTALPATTNNAWLAPWWDDLQGRAGGGVYFLQTGTPGNIETIISWENWSEYPSSTYTGMSLNFQIRIKPNGDVEYHYGNNTAGPGTDADALAAGSSASVWIEAASAADIFVARTSDATMPTVNPLVGGLAIRYRAMR